MSIYSGFATRQLQQTYDQYLQTVLYIFQKRLLKFYRGQLADEQKFLTVLNKLHSQMKSMQNHKYLQPKSSNTFQQLLIYLKSRQSVTKQVTNKPQFTYRQMTFTQQIQKIPIQSNTFLIRQNSFNPNTVLAANTLNNVKAQNSQNLQSKIKKQSQKSEQQLQKKQKIKQILQQSRPITTQNQNRIRNKKIISKSSHSNNTNRKDSYSFYEIHNKPENCLPDGQNDQNETQQNQEQINQKLFQFSKQPFQHILNPSASKFAIISRNEKRQNFIKSHQTIKSKKSSSKVRSKQKQSSENFHSLLEDGHQIQSGRLSKIRRSNQKHPNSNTISNINTNTKNNGTLNENNESIADKNVRDLIKGYISKTKKSYIKSYNKHKNEIDEMLKLM